MDIKEIGELGKMQIEWRIENFFSFTQKGYRCASPTFPFADVQWHLRLCMNYTAQPEKGISVFLMSDVKRDNSVEYHFGLKNRDGSVEELVNGILRKKAMCTDELFLTEKAELQRRKTELVPYNTLTIILALNLLSEKSNSTSKEIKENLKLIRLDKLSENFKEIFDDKKSCDVTLKVKGVEYKAHRSVLMARSSVLAANFKHDMLENKTGVITIPDCDPDTFHKFLTYLYCGKLEALSYRSAMNLYYTSEKYDVKEVKAFCLDNLLQCLNAENLCDVAEFADKHNETKLLSEVQDFFNKNSLKVFLTSEWQQLLKNNYHLVNNLLTRMAKDQLKE